MKNKDNKKISLTLIALGIIISFFGGSLAYWNWETSTAQRTLVSVQVQGATLTIEGSNIEHTGMYPTNDCDGNAALIGEVATATAVNGTASDMEVIIKIRASLSVKQGSMTSDKKDKINWALIDTSDGTTCETTPYKGTMSTVTSNTDIDTGIRFTATKNATTSRSYRLYVWLDSTYTHTNVGDDVSDPTQNIGISVKYSPASELSQESAYSSSSPNEPVLDAGMIPITISADGVATTVSTTDPTWYNYSNKKWANAVLVRESGTQTRSYYKTNTGVTVAKSDILAYYVWIPRYKYKIWTLGQSSAGQEQSINIVFESANAQVTQGSQVGDYITHPAFIWDGTPIAGLWVGKFETTGDATTPTILPNSSSLRNQNVSTQFTTSLKFAGGTLSDGIVSFAGNNTYGLISTTDSHMMKNSEWGAVAYLSHSRYGINGKIRINNNSYQDNTGCGASEENGSNTNKCQISYGSASSYPQSTTGNIAGVFDMSGGSFEYIMGWYSGANSNYATDNSYFGWTSSENYAGFTNQIPSKYWDNYTTTSSLTACNGGICFGHALSETEGWYSGLNAFVEVAYPWIKRGGMYGASNSDLWFITTNNGINDGWDSFRSVLISGL